MIPIMLTQCIVRIKASRKQIITKEVHLKRARKRRQVNNRKARAGAETIALTTIFGQMGSKQMCPPLVNRGKVKMMKPFHQVVMESLE